MFENIVDNGGCNHQDSIQAVNATGVIVVGNLFANDEDGFVDFDASSSDTATDNACYNVTRPACVTLYSDRNSIVAHNTARAGEAVLELNIKPGQADGEGTRFENNIGGVTGSGYRLGMDTHNVFTGATAPNINGNPSFVGGAAPTSWSGVALTQYSAGHRAATDRRDVGISVGERPSAGH